MQTTTTAVKRGFLRLIFASTKVMHTFKKTLRIMNVIFKSYFVFKNGPFFWPWETGFFSAPKSPLRVKMSFFLKTNRMQQQ